MTASPELLAQLETEIAAWTLRNALGTREHARRAHEDVLKDAELMQLAQADLPRFAEHGFPITEAHLERLRALLDLRLDLIGQRAASRVGLHDPDPDGSLEVAAAQKNVGQQQRRLLALLPELGISRRVIQFTPLSRTSLWGDAADAERLVARMDVLIAAGAGDALKPIRDSVAESALVLRRAALAAERVAAREPLLDTREAAIHALLWDLIRQIARWGRLLPLLTRKVPRHYRLPHTSKARNPPGRPGDDPEDPHEPPARGPEPPRPEGADAPPPSARPELPPAMDHQAAARPPRSPARRKRKSAVDG
ncbi:MAG: hypothetical protein AB2A00_33030 [Myxococcota bacterium]